MPQTWIELPFADGEYIFKLTVAGIEELERKASEGLAAPVGFGRIYGRTRVGRFGFGVEDALPDLAEYRWVELKETIRQGLIGGGGGVVDGSPVKVTPELANLLVKRYLVEATDLRWAMNRTWALAYAILHAFGEGYTPPKKDEPGESPAA